MTSRWSNPTGGLGYHLTAWFRQRRLWAPFRTNIARWLSQWAPPERELLLIGPSGGYCLDLAFLGSFSRVTAVDIDPFARWIFRIRARRVLRANGVTLHWDARDYLSAGNDGFSLDGLRELLGAHPNAAVLFCNILGQLPLLGDDRDPAHDDGTPREGSFEHWLHGLPDVLHGRSWATFHDRLSGGLKPYGLDADTPVPWSASEEIVEAHYKPPRGKEVELVDHRTSELMVDAPRWQFTWEIAPRVFHLIEAVSVRATASRPT